MTRKFLDDIGVTDTPDTWNRDDNRQKKWEEERGIYGFDERETWAMELSFHLWLYERLKRYVEIARIDLDYHRFEYQGTIYTQRQMIDMMIKRLEFSFKPEYNDCDEKQYQYVSEIEQIWAIVLPSMWW